MERFLIKYGKINISKIAIENAVVIQKLHINTPVTDEKSLFSRRTVIF